MSGGVDSSAAALLMKKNGLDGIGITMKLWEYRDVGGNIRHESGCCSIDAVHHAKAVCSKLGMPHYTIDRQQDFRARVIDNFIDEYMHGRTPNPCVLCNMTVRWDALFKLALDLDADLYATGHYARTTFDASRNRFILRRGLDRSKDQSYMLWGLSQRQLSKTSFPVGDYTKKEIRKLSREHELPTADLPDSQEICFVGDNDYGRFLNEQVEGLKVRVSDGPLMDAEGKQIGTHRGYPFYTIGQRKGLGIALGKPAYVYAIDPRTNTVYVGDESRVYTQGLTAFSVNWVSIQKPEGPIEADVMVRYNDPGYRATVYPEGDDRVRIIFREPRKAVTPGQSVVWYDGDDVLGGGIIKTKIDQ